MFVLWRTPTSDHRITIIIITTIRIMVAIDIITMASVAEPFTTEVEVATAPRPLAVRVAIIITIITIAITIIIFHNQITIIGDKLRSLILMILLKNLQTRMMMMMR